MANGARVPNGSSGACGDDGIGNRAARRGASRTSGRTGSPRLPRSVRVLSRTESRGRDGTRGRRRHPHRPRLTPARPRTETSARQSANRPPGRRRCPPGGNHQRPRQGHQHLLVQRSRVAIWVYSPAMKTNIQVQLLARDWYAKPNARFPQLTMLDGLRAQDNQAAGSSTPT